MTTRTTWVLGNWKQNHLREAAERCAGDLVEGIAGTTLELHPSAGAVEVGLAPSFLALDAVAQHARPNSGIWLLAQDVAAQESGAFTGEVGPKMLAEAGVTGAIVGHSERRAMFGDHDELVAAKVARSLEAGLLTVMCVGESLEARDAGDHETTVISQLSAGLSQVKDEWLSRLVIAYEPVWAIGTGRTATPQQARDMHCTIRASLGERFGDGGRGRSILYGGSVKPSNAAELIGVGELDGFLVGGASLDAKSFMAIIKAAAETPRP